MIVALTGYARSGKDSVGAILTEHYGFRRVAFGDVLKRIAEDVDPPVEIATEDGSTHGRVSALLELFGSWESVKDEVPEARQLLVDLGNSLRLRIPGIEVGAALAGVGPEEDVVNTNVYHPEEIDQLREMGALVVRVSRPGHGPANADEARTALHPVDVELANDGTLDDLAVKVAQLIDYHRGQ